MYILWLRNVCIHSPSRPDSGSFGPVQVEVDGDQDFPLGVHLTKTPPLDEAVFRWSTAFQRPPSSPKRAWCCFLRLKVLHLCRFCCAACFVHSTLQLQIAFLVEAIHENLYSKFVWGKGNPRRPCSHLLSFWLAFLLFLLIVLFLNLANQLAFSFADLHCL